MLVTMVKFDTEDQTNDERTAQYDQWRRKGVASKGVVKELADVVG